MNRESKYGPILLVWLAAAAPGDAAAQSTAKPAAQAPAPLGRLFFTPAQRASLDVARSQRARTTVATEGTEEAAPPAAQSITYGGVVRRSDGRSTAWINGRPVSDNDLAGGAPFAGRVRPDGGVSLQVPQTGRRIELKPGQSVELLSGTVEEGYTRKPPAPGPKPAATPDGAGKPAAKPALPERNGEEAGGEEQKRKVEEAVRTLQEAAAKSGTRPFVPPPVPPR